jgi:hypothetical protein
MIAYLRDRCIVLDMKSVWMIAVILFCMAYGLGAQKMQPAPSPIATKPQPRANFNGRWEGIQVIQSEMPRVVADVVFIISDTEREFSGAAMFHSRARQGKGQWRPAGNFGSPMLSPHVEGKVLTFKLSFRTSEGVEKVMDYKMEMIGPNQAIFDYVEATATDMSARMTRKHGK